MTSHARLALLALALLLVAAPGRADERSVNPGQNIIDQGGTRTITGDAASPVTIRNWFFDLILDANDWPHGPQLLDAAAVSSINVLSGPTTPRSFYGFELAVSRTRAATSLPHVGGANAIRGMEITLHDDHDVWETPHDADRWTGLGIYAHQGRTLGVGLAIGGAAGFDRPLVIVGRDGREVFGIDRDGTLYLHGRRVTIDADGVLRLR